jgi:hypothetical protein
MERRTTEEWGFQPSDDDLCAGDGDDRVGSVLEHARLYYSMGLICFPLPRGSKEPAKNFRWGEYLQRRPTWEEIRSKIREREENNLAIITGKVSDGLGVRDFDSEEAYSHWKSHHPDVANQLPTVRTSRGYHVYGRGTATKTVKFTDGEFRYGVYVLAPPSIHPDGSHYTWIQLIGDEIPTIDFFRIGSTRRLATAG